MFANDVTGNLPFGDLTYTRYSDLLSMVALFGNIAFYLILTWYFDHVVESNRGRGESPFFPFIKIKNLIMRNRQRKVAPQVDEVEQLRNPNFLLQDEE